MQRIKCFVAVFTGIFHVDVGISVVVEPARIAFLSLPALVVLVSNNTITRVIVRAALLALRDVQIHRFCIDIDGTATSKRVLVCMQGVTLFCVCIR